MIKHHLKIALRNILKYKVQNVIGIVGMATGLVAFVFGYQWYKYETTFDSFYPKSDRLYMVSGVETQTGKKQRNLPLSLLYALQSEFPEIETATALYGKYGSSYKSGDKEIGDPEVEFVDESFLDYFTPQLICGKDVMLKQEDETVITRSFAEKFWNTPEDALGETVTSGYDFKFTISSVIEDFPENSIFHSVEMWEPDIITRKYNQQRDPVLKWKQQEVIIFICLNESENPDDFNNKLENYLIDRKYNEELALRLIPISGIRHTFGQSFRVEGTFSLNYIYIFIIATFILFLCVLVNYTNLYFNSMYGRTREMMLRHAVGAGKKQLLSQAIAELSIQFILIFILSCCFIELLLPVFTNILNISMDKSSLWTSLFYVTLIALAIVFLIQIPLFLYFIRNASLQVSALGSKAHQSAIFRKTLMIFQVGICVGFMLCALGTGKQIFYFSQKDIGFQKEGLLHFLSSNKERNLTLEEIEKIPLIENITAAGVFHFQNDPGTTSAVDWNDKPDNYKPIFQIIECDKDFPLTMKLELLEGRYFDETDNVPQRWGGNKIGLINEEAARIIGYDNIIGKKIKVWNGIINVDGTYETDEMEIVGIVKDFQTTGSRTAQLPIIIVHVCDRYSGYTYYVRVGKGNEEKAKQDIVKAFEKHAIPFDPVPEVYTINEIFDELNKSENSSFQLFCILAVLSILISVFGIYSISESSIYRRRKEIAIHKVMGGSTYNITTMLLAEYIRISLLSNLLFIPIAWYFLNKWLQQFPYHTNIGWLDILIILAITTGLITITVLRHILKAASENPADVIKSE